jgi:hypothetical protein
MAARAVDQRSQYARRVPYPDPEKQSLFNTVTTQIMTLHTTITSEHGIKTTEGDQFLEISVKDSNDQEQELMMIRIVPIEGANQYQVRMMAKLRDTDYDYLGSSVGDDGQAVYKVQDFTLHGTH